MALRTNSKQVKETIKSYIMEHFEDAFENYRDKDGVFYCDDLQKLENTDKADYSSVCDAILAIFHAEKVQHDLRAKAGRISRFTLFEDWVSGLCSAIDSDYYYNVNAVDLLGGWLQQTEAEKARFSESEAEYMITSLIWRELTAHSSK